MIDLGGPEITLTDPRLLLGAATLALALIVLLAGKLAGTRRHLAERTRAAEDLARRLEVAEADAVRLAEAEQALREANTQLNEQDRTVALLEQQLRNEKEQHQARIEDMTRIRKELEDRFQSLASGVLQKNSESFLNLVSERFKQHQSTAQEDLAKRQTAIDALVKPLNEKLGKFDSMIGQIEKSRNEAYGQIREQMAALARNNTSLEKETRKLVQALRAPKSRGRWGEMQLRQVFEMAGMAEHVDFELERSFDTDQGRQRPDAIVRLPGGKVIVVDAKTPLEAFLNALEAETPDAQQAQMVHHARQVRQHVKLLSSKAYHDMIAETPDFVVMFIPGETFVSAAVEADPGLLEYAFENRVLIATPTTLIALVKAIAYGWQQEKMAENAVEVQKAAKELYDRLGVFAGHVDKVGKSLRQSVDHFNRAVGSFEARVLPSARKFETMGVVSAEGATSIAQVDVEPRGLAVELPGSD
ncbi:DNA polymerase V [Defluviimonas sp. 20V17]|uniref:DNA recombination protein RmuC homolog n=1 Tax=Allgaiera indica TaxID=765699 RepID=A0AAN4ZZP2_9RHOB|nr:DNA recombination protein RmuC [Allgaiera indica]KDB02616.1 DNA polymerase V [Defluviimonas sp. 20V17]GHE01672.1 hypothetical protein GCM10008024_17990 [Allgaiera indica]SDW96645.1 DNA recombination protein RmuC [Allgaiera indica]